jgi:hypothetical protein
MKGLAVTVVAVVVGLLVAEGSASAKVSSDTFPVTFTLSSATCLNLPNGTTVNGSGTEKSITNTKTDRGGITTIVNTTHANGKATDQAGNRYVFNYSNHFNVSNTTANQGVFSGKMDDSFSLAGPGPAHVHNGFLATFTTDLTTFVSLEPIHSRGDPIGFPDGTAHCDPL